MAAPTRLLKQYLALLTDDNAQKEFYLTDVVKHAVADGTPVLALQIDDEVEVAGVNSPVQLAELEREVQQRAARRLMEAGVRLADPARFDLRGELTAGRTWRLTSAASLKARSHWATTCASARTA
jgi:bifunctional UDP-N-acetylglucosamine pyrophosphorylase/glucosamine-1-phosphate N-acetyltransferase